MVKGTRICQACGAHTRNPKFCSNQCQNDLKWQKTLASIDSTGVIAIGASGNPCVAKRFLLHRQGRVSAVCGLTEWRGQPVPLVLDHVNGDALDWSVANLRLVCGNCDMQLPTIKSRNRGRGRATRRQRYRDGLSY